MRQATLKQRPLTNISDRVGCDVCERWGFRITRVVCLHCSDDGLETLDLCADCEYKDCFRASDKKTHLASHPLLQARRYLFWRETLDLVQSAKLKATRVNSPSAIHQSPANGRDSPCNHPADLSSLGHTETDRGRPAAAKCDGKNLRPSWVSLSFNLYVSASSSSAQCVVCQRELERPFWMCLDCPGMQASISELRH